MKAHFRYLALIASALFLLYGCSSSNDTPSETILNINPVLGDFTNYSGETSSFSSGDAIGLYAVLASSSSTPTSTDKVFNREYTYNGSSWSTSDKNIWPDGADGSECNLYAYAPYDSNSGVFSSHFFTCPTDQSSFEKIHKADFIYSSTVAAKSSSAVALNMSHLFSIVTLNIKYGTGINDILTQISFNALNNATINLNNGSAVAYGSTSDIIPYKLTSASDGYSKSYSFILPPQSVSGDCITLTYSDGTSTTVSVAETFEKAMHYSVNMSVIGKKDVILNGITVSPWDDQIAITGGIVKSVNDYTTGDVITYMKNRTTNPVTFVVIPEGFTKDELTYGGLFEQKARAAMDFLFNVEPYKTYKNYFNVYFIAAISNEQGADSTTSKKYKDTYFDAGWEDDGVNYDMTANADKVFSFVKQYCPDIVQGKTTINNVAIIMMINDQRYGGITYTYSDGRAFAMCPLTSGNLTWAGQNPSVTGYSKGDWRNILTHESGGHCFGKLQDEYWYDNSSSYTGTTISSHSWTVPFGKNITADTSSTSTTYFWKQMVGSTQFPKENAWEGGMGYAKGVYRPENVSCMIDNRRYFNAYSRQLIVERILSLAGETFDYNTFVSKDVNYDEILDSSSSSVIHTQSFSKSSNEKIYPLLPHPRLVNE